MTVRQPNNGCYGSTRQSVTLRPDQGFTLVEMAVVLMIVGLLLGGLIPAISSQLEQRRTNETRKILEEMKDALFGFAVANGRLPCPASSTSNGMESFCTNPTGACTETTTLPSHGHCAKPYDGFVPAVTLGIAPVSAQGQLLDAWGNPVHFAITNAKDASGNFYFTATNGIKTRWNSGILPDPDLRVCSTSTNLTTTTPDSADCASGKALTNNAVAVIYSLGKNSATGGSSGDEDHNPNPQTTKAADRAFVFHEPAAAGSTNGEFDDIVTWLSPNILYNRMVMAGKLP
ncbi:MAG: prepilin-type N-terminal cleavage/methylation domain-containing protein [Gallionellaceae bacterium]|nr:prepilin-type N-terminal cleavage/methylation domain-containing protein [Gallionellaceae bacterium]